MHKQKIIHHIAPILEKRGQTGTLSLQRKQKSGCVAHMRERISPTNLGYSVKCRRLQIKEDY
jgi:hypothetical protein